MRDISYFEVALRNAYNDVMEARWDGAEHWLLDDASPVRRPVVRRSGRGSADVNRVNRKIIDVAASGLPDGFSPGDLVSNLTLGFWVHLTDRSREAVIWRTGLYAAWPKGTRRAELQDRLDGILRVRNRIAHNERLFNPSRAQLSPVRANADARELLGQLCPEAAAYAQGPDAETIGDFLSLNPAPVGVRL
nr:MAG TPA: Abi-like protein [Caudoviricetes sp.]